MNGQRILLVVIGLVAVAVGVVWTLQGVGLLGGSVMTGATQWAIIGPIVGLVGAFLVYRGVHRKAS